jgi:mannosyl-oligosaccharide glucosidase
MGGLQTGIAWGPSDGSGTGTLRHGCRHDHKLQGWGWQEHDSRHYGRQLLGDMENGLNITIEFTQPDETFEGYRSILQAAMRHLTSAPASAAAEGTESVALGADGNIVTPTPVVATAPPPAAAEVDLDPDEPGITLAEKKKRQRRRAKAAQENRVNEIAGVATPAPGSAQEPLRRRQPVDSTQRAAMEMLRTCRPWVATIRGQPTERSKRLLKARHLGAEKADDFVSLFLYVSVADGSLRIQRRPATETEGTFVAVTGSKNPHPQAPASAKPKQFSLLAWEKKPVPRPRKAITHYSIPDLVDFLSKNAWVPFPTNSSDFNLPRYVAAKIGSDDAWRTEDLLTQELTRSKKQATLGHYTAKMTAIEFTKKYEKDKAGVVTTGSKGETIVYLTDSVRDEINQPIIPLLADSFVYAKPTHGNDVQFVSAPQGLTRAFLQEQGAPAADVESPNPNFVALQYLVPNNQEFEINLAFLQEDCAVRSGRPLEPADAGPSDRNVDHWIGTLDSMGLGRQSTLNVSGVYSARFAEKLCSYLGVCRDDKLHGRQLPDKHFDALAHAVSNLVGSITYFHGKQLVEEIDARTSQLRTVESKPHGLMTGVPSRSFFPRGFLWDEGFHQLLVSQWNPALTRTVLMSWLDTMEVSTGWIAREQILGGEARSRVPEAFRLQKRDIANPPTLLFPMLALAVDGMCTDEADDPAGHPLGSDILVGPDGVTSVNAGRDQLPRVDSAEAATRVRVFCGRHTAEAIRSGECLYACRRERAMAARDQSWDAQLKGGPSSRVATFGFLRHAYPKLVRFYEWFKNTQAGERPNTFRWRGATVDHNFASGLDDYPRGRAPSDADENVDLLAWMAAAANILGDFADLMGQFEDARRFRSEYATFQKGLEAHWNEEEEVFCDIGLPREAVPGTPAYDTVTQVCHVGYVSLMPFFLRLVHPRSPKLLGLMHVIANDRHVWSNYGLRSLSASDKLFATKEDYWRNSVWINMNYLAVSSLQFYSQVESDFASRAGRLSELIAHNVVNNIVAEYNRTGFLWEHYDSRTGKGRGTHPFTGWTALFALLHSHRFPL